MPRTGRPTRSKEEARALGLTGWNIRCNVCGDYGAAWWHRVTRIGFGSYALCELDRVRAEQELDRHYTALEEVLKVNYEQDR